MGNSAGCGCNDTHATDNRTITKRKPMRTFSNNSSKSSKSSGTETYSQQIDTLCSLQQNYSSAMNANQQDYAMSVSIASGKEIKKDLKKLDERVPNNITFGQAGKTTITFDKSLSYLEFCVKTQVFTREFPDANTETKESSKNKHKSFETELVYTISIGDIIVKTWTAADIDDEDDQQEACFVEQLKGDEHKKRTAPPMRTRRFKIPFQFHFVSRNVTLEIRDDINLLTMFEGTIPFEQLMIEPQLMQELTINKTNLDERNLVRISAHEIDESQNMLFTCRIKLPKAHALEMLKQMKVYELLTLKYGKFRIVIQHQYVELHQNQEEATIMMSIPQYQTSNFQNRNFMIKFEQLGIVEFNGVELTQVTVTERAIVKPLKDDITRTQDYRLNTQTVPTQESETDQLKGEMTPEQYAKQMQSCGELNVQIFGCQHSRLQRPISVINYIQTGDLRVVPLIAIDFSMGNITFDKNMNLHSTQAKKANDYRDLIKMLGSAYGNILNLPIFGYGAKTSRHSQKASALFPLSRSIRNPFTPNEPEQLMQTYTECLQDLELSVPVLMAPLLNFFRKLGVHVKNRINRKAKHNTAIKGTCDSFYVLYFLSTGLIDDITQCLQVLSEEWSDLPLQLHIISLAPAHIAEQDQDSVALMHQCNLQNLQSGWPQFQVHFYDRIKQESNKRSNVALIKLKSESVLRVPRDVESFLFRNRMDLSKYRHNQNNVNATQSHQYVMDLIDQKFESLKVKIYKLGIQPVQFKSMVESHALFEWSPEVAIALSTKFCTQVITEEPAAEDDLTVVDQKSGDSAVRQPSVWDPTPRDKQKVFDLDEDSLSNGSDDEVQLELDFKAATEQKVLIDQDKMERAVSEVVSGGQTELLLEYQQMENKRKKSVETREDEELQYNNKSNNSNSKSKSNNNQVIDATDQDDN